MKSKFTVFTENLFSNIITICFSSLILWASWNYGLRVELHQQELSFAFFACLTIFVNVLFRLDVLQDILNKQNVLNYIISNEILRQMSKDGDLKMPGLDIPLTPPIEEKIEKSEKDT